MMEATGSVDKVMELQKHNENPRRKAAKVIREIERRGGFALKCGCIIACRAAEMRRLMETSSPEAVIEIASTIRTSHDHPKRECKYADV